MLVVAIARCSDNFPKPYFDFLIEVALLEVMKERLKIRELEVVLVVSFSPLSAAFRVLRTRV